MALLGKNQTFLVLIPILIYSFLRKVSFSHVIPGRYAPLILGDFRVLILFHSYGDLTTELLVGGLTSELRYITRANRFLHKQQRKKGREEEMENQFLI